MTFRNLAGGFLAALSVVGCAATDDPVPPDPGTQCPPATPLSITAPAVFPEFRSPASNPLTVEGAALGRRLFYDPILSGDSTQACASCHVQAGGFGDPRRFSIGIDGIEGDRQAPTIVNPVYLNESFWDGRTKSLEDQAREPVPNPIEMHLPWQDAVSRLEAHPDYPDLFCAAFGTTEISQNRVVRAIAQFERTFVSWDSHFDRVQRGEATFTPEEAAGFALFGSEIGDCFHCHDEVLFSTRTFHNIGLDSIPVDPGLGGVTNIPDDFGKFKAPTLRNIMLSSPYMHDGRFTTIDEVFNHYNGGFHDGPATDPLIRARVGPGRRLMRSGEIDTLITFLQTLTDTTFVNRTSLANPFVTP